MIGRVDIEFVIVDVFTRVPFAGNQLCVVSEPPPELDEATMLAITGEIGFSETTFVTAVGPGSYDVRIFTPGKELPFAGHPTLGTAFVLVAGGRVGSPLVQHSAAGEVPVDVDLASGTARMRQLPPVISRPIVDRAAIAAGAGLAPDDLVPDLPILTVSTGIPHAMVAVRDEQTLRRATRDDRACRAACDLAGEAESLYLFTVRGPGDVMARMFDRGGAIGEDPATGSAAGPLAVYLAAHGLAGMPGHVTIAQGELVGRPSFLEAEVWPAGESWDVAVSGGVHIVGEGVFRI